MNNDPFDDWWKEERGQEVGDLEDDNENEHDIE